MLQGAQEIVNLDDKYALVFVQASLLAESLLRCACCMYLSPMQTGQSAHRTAWLVELLKGFQQGSTSFCKSLDCNTFESEVAMFVHRYCGLVLALIKHFRSSAFFCTYSCHLPSLMIQAIAKICYATLCNSWQKVVFLCLPVLDIL